MPLQPLLLLSAALFCVGIYGVVSRRNAVGILLSVELMMNAVNINLVAFSHYRGDHVGQTFAVFSIALTVAEVVVGLALVILLYRARKDVAVDTAHALGEPR
ncbi:MAG: NADH-quinone oxidoreductase subunit NuoK [Myxococcales bacterium]|nr:NADH-quinone oxidoreductase subunit NuoK [Myxococcales bacterium]